MMRIFSNILTVFVVMVFMSGMFSSTYALTPKDDKGVITLKSPGLAYEAPEWVTPFTLDTAPEDVEYWRGILPYSVDKDADMYIVLPTIGVVSPVIFVPEGTKDYNEMVSGKQIEINNYLDRGVMHYPKSGIPGEEGNPVIFGHSNFFADGIGDYKTIFADIMNLDAIPYDEMWIYVKEDSGEYDLRKFSIEKSFDTTPENVSVMIPKGGKELTVFACTNGLAGRWILKGRYIEDDEVLVPYPTKWKTLDLLELLEAKPKQEQQQIIGTLMGRIDEVLKNTSSSHYHDKLKRYILKYIEKELALRF